MSRTLVFTRRRTAFKFQQRRIEPFSFGDETLMLLLERLQTRSRPFQFGLRSGSGISLRNIAPGAFEFDFRSATLTFVFQLHFIVTDHSLDQLVSGNHPLLGALQFSSFLCGDLWSAPAGVCHSHYSRWIFRTEAKHLAANFLRDQNGAPMNMPMMQIMKRIVGLAELVFFGMEVDEAAIRQRHQLDEFGVGANQIADDGLFRRDHVDGRELDLAAVTYDVVVAAVRRHRDAFGNRVALPDEIDHGFGAAPTG